jgi:sarcosine oxidase delta subunit
MPKKQAQIHSWTVLVTRSASEEIKAQIERGKHLHFSMDDLIYTTDTVYRGWSEEWACVRFYRVSRDSVTDPLVINVLMLRDSRLDVCVTINRRKVFKLAFGGDLG